MCEFFDIEFVGIDGLQHTFNYLVRNSRQSVNVILLLQIIPPVLNKSNRAALQ
jgi:hypothetical protein